MSSAKSRNPRARKTPSADDVPSRWWTYGISAAAGALLFLMLSTSNVPVADRLVLAGTDVVLVIAVSEILREGLWDGTVQRGPSSAAHTTSISGEFADQRGDDPPGRSHTRPGLRVEHAKNRCFDRAGANPIEYAPSRLQGEEGTPAIRWIRSSSE